MSMVLRLEPSWMNLMVLIDDYSTCCCYMLSFIVDLWYYLIYTVLYFSWPMISTQYPWFVLTPTFMFFFLLFVECSKRAVIFDSTVTQASLTTPDLQGELTLLAWTGSSPSCLDSLNFRHGLASYVFLAFRILLV